MVEALQEAAFFILDTPAPAPRAAPFDSMFTRGTRGSNQSGLAVPIFLFEPLHGRCIGVLDLEPVGRPTGPV